MQAFIIEKSNELGEICRRFRVRRLDLFGSAAAGGFDPSRSDLDFLVEFEPITPMAYADRFFGLLQALEALFGRHIDLVPFRAVVNPYLAQGIRETQQNVYAA